MYTYFCIPPLDCRCLRAIDRLDTTLCSLRARRPHLRLLLFTATATVGLRFLLRHLLEGEIEKCFVRLTILAIMLRFASLRVAPPSHLHLRLSPIPNHTNQRLSIVVSPFLPLSTSSRTSKTRVTLTTPFAPWTAATSWADGEFRVLLCD